nr:MAG TPA: Tape measure domain protein [Caudoviricetes sp.]
MAGGNLGNLFVSLGIKDEMSNALQKIIKEMKGVDQATQDAKKRGEELVSSLNSINGNNFSKVFRDANEYIEKNSKGVSGIVKMLNTLKAEDLNALTSKFLGARNFTNIASILRTANAELEKMSSNEDKAGNVKIWQSKISNALDYIKLLQDINEQQKKINNTKSENPNVDTKSLDNARKSLAGIRSEIAGLLSSGGIDDANVLKGFQKLLSVAKKDVKDIVSTFKKDNVLSNFSGGAAKVEADIARVTEKLAKMRDLMSEGTQKGYSTSMLTGSISELDNILTRLNAAKLNPTMLTDAAQMRNLISDVLVEMVKATAATQAYGREKGKVIAQEKAAAEDYNRQRRQRDAAKKAQDEELKALSDYAKRYMELQEAKIKADKKASDERKRQSEAERKRIETDTARMSKLYATMSLAIGRGERAGIRGLELGVNTSALEKALSDATELKKRIEDTNIALMGKGGRPSYSSYAEEVNKLSSSLINATNAQKDLNSAQDKANRKAEAQATRDAAKAKQEDATAEKQRQREIGISTQRINSLSDALNRLKSARFTAKMLGINTDEISQQIYKVIDSINLLETARKRLEGKDKDALGSIGQIGNGREVQLANRVAAEYEKSNREVQKGIELEQKRQQEIAQTAAKVQSDLVRGFERANSHAGKLNSTIQDLKSLFLQGGLVFGAQQFAMSIITTGGEMEKQHIALQSILGDMQNANTMFNQIKELALNSPFTFSELNRDVKQLAAYGVEYDQLYDTTKRLADMSSGLGVSFDRIALAFGQVQARGWLDGKELRQIAYAGIPLLDKLSKFYSNQEGRNVSTSEIKTRISNREVSFDDVKSIFWQMTDAGGQFYNMQQVLSETLLGRYNKLKDAWEIMLAEFASGDSLVGKFFKTALDGATALVQSLHTLAMPMGAIFAGYAFKKMAAGNTASGFLSNKANLASNIQNKVLQGQALTQIEQRILATKNQITGADLRALANARALTAEKLNQLRLSGKITAEQYNIYRGIVLRQTGEKTIRMEMLRTLVTMRSMTASSMFSSLKNVWPGFAASFMASFRIIGTGIKALGTTIWSAIGGLPGLVISGLTFGITYAISEYQALSQKIKQTQDEIADKNKQISDFLRDNNVSAAISGGDTKEIDNMIDSYKEKLKELAPYSYKNMLMTANEENDHKKRLQYLENEIKLLKEANDIANTKLSNRGYYSDLSDATEDVIDAFKKREEMRVAAMASDASAGDKELYANEKAYDDYIESLKKKLEKKFGDIGKDEKMREAAMQAMSGIFSSIGVPEDKADIMRTSILQAFGCGDKSAWLQSEVSNSLTSLIDKSFPMIGEKIKASIPLNDAEKAKVKELMNDAKNGLIRQYPELEHTLQNMLAASNFQAVIRLVLDGGGKLNNLQSELVKRIPSRYSGLIMSETSGKYKAFAEKWGKEDSWYSARNAAQSDIDKAKNEYLSAKASKAKNASELYTAWQTVKQAAKDLLYYDYDGSGKKSNKVPKSRNRNTGNQEDKELETLRKRIELYKKFYSELEKYRKLYGDEGAMIQMKSDKEFMNSVLSWGLSDPGTYGLSIEELMKRVPSSTQKRREYKEDQLAGIHAKNRSAEEDRIRSANNQLSKQLNIISEQYETYKKIYELTGNNNGAAMLAFGHTQSGTYQDYLKEQMGWAVKDHNQRTGENLSAEDVLGMSESDFRKYIGEESEDASVIYKAWVEETKRIKKETIDLMASLIEKNATIAQQIEDENRKYENQLELIKGIEDPQMRERVSEGATKTHNENLAKLQFEQFKQESDWVAIFDDLDRVSSATINTMISNIDEFSRTTGLSIEVVKQLRDALDKLRNEQIDRNPLPSIFGGVRRGNAIGEILKGNRKIGASGINISDAQAKKTGLIAGKWYSNADLENSKKGAYNDSSKAITSLSGKMQALSNIMDPVINLFEALGEQNSILGQIAGGASNAFSAAANVSGGLSALGLGSAGPYGAAAAAALSVGSSLIKAFGADYSSYEKAKAEYDNLTSIWDSLISKKTEYMNIHWGTEAIKASKEAQEMLKAEIEQTKIIAKDRLNSGSSAGSHSIWYRMWKGSYKYNGQNWRDVAGDISSKYGVQFNGMEDMLNMNADTLSEIKKNYTGLWANMDSEFRDYLEKLIQYGEKADDMVEAITEKLTGNKFSDLVSSWGDAMATMANSSDNLVEHFEDNLKKTILNSMIENLYKDKINALLEKTKKYGDPNGGTENIKDSNGNVISEYTGAEYADVKNSTEDLSKQIEATRDFLKKTYGWSDNSSSSSRNSVKGITEETADILLSYVNAIRLDCSVMRAEQAKYYPEMSEIAKSQLTQLNTIARNTLRNADAAERIERIFVEYNDNFNRVLNGTKSLKMK